MSYAQWVSIYVCSFMQFVIFCFTDFVCYCMGIYVPSLNEDFIIISIVIIIIIISATPVQTLESCCCCTTEHNSCCHGTPTVLLQLLINNTSLHLLIYTVISTIHVFVRSATQALLPKHYTFTTQHQLFTVPFNSNNTNLYILYNMASLQKTCNRNITIIVPSKT